MDSLRPFGILELGRTGAVAMARGQRSEASNRQAAEAVVAPISSGTMSV